MIKNQIQVSVSNDGFVDQGDGVVSFPNGLTITDDSVMRSGTCYDVNSLDISKYQGQLTADHIDSLGTLIGKTMGVQKQGNRVTVSGIQYAVNQNPMARVAYNLLTGGFSNSFSIETIGPYPDQADPVYRNHELVGLSQVVIPNNYNAKVNQFNEIVHNSLERSKSDGLDITGIEETIINSAIRTALPLGSQTSWDSGTAKKNVVKYASDSEGNIDFTKYRKAFFWVDPSNKNVQSGYKLPFADVEDGNLVAEWPGVAAAMGALNGSQGGVDIPEADKKGVYNAIAYYYKKFKKDVPEFKSSADPIEEESMTKKENDTSVIEEVVLNNAEPEVETPAKVEEPVVDPVEEKVETPEVPAEEPKEPETPEEPETPVEEEPAKVEDEPKEEPVAADTDEGEPEEKTTEPEKEEEVENKTNKNEEKLEMTAEQIAEIVANAIKPLADDLAATKELAQNAFDVQAKEPEFKEVEKVEEVKNAYVDLTSDELFSKQLNAAVAAERLQSVEGRKVLNEINARNLQSLKDAKIVNASTSLEDLGNFVIGPELYNQVATARSNFSVLVDATNWHETNMLEFGWLTRSSDIDMQSVAIGVFEDANGADARLKPVSQTTYGAHTDKLEELAAVTPISINVIKFAAADILTDIAEGYSTDYDRKRAQLVVARLQQAVDSTGTKYVFDISDGLVGWARVTALIADVTTIGTLVFNNKTLTVLKGQALENFNSSLLAEINTGSILGIPFIVVPNSLMPTLNTTETKTFYVYGSPVTIDQAVFYGDLRTFTGRSSGGLKYDVDASASYEIDGTVYSAYQRNEIVLRGAFFRGGVVKDTQLIASIPASAVS